MASFAKKSSIFVLSLLTFSALSLRVAVADHDHHAGPPAPTDIPGAPPEKVEKTNQSKNDHVDNRNHAQEAAEPAAPVNFEPSTPASFEPLPTIEIITPMIVPAALPAPDVFSASTLAAPPAAEAALVHDHGQLAGETSALMSPAAMEGNHAGHLTVDVNSIRAVSGGIQIRYNKSEGIQESAADHVHFQLVVNGVPQEEEMDRDFDGSFLFPMEKVPQGEFEIRGFVVNKDHKKIDNTDFAKKFIATVPAKKDVAVPKVGGKESVFIEEKLNASKLNREPVLEPVGDLVVSAREKMTVQLVATDPEGAPLTFEALPLPSGALFNRETGLLEWVPETSQSLEITFSVTDGKNVVSQTTSITVLG